ncbi:unnamed protein product, partial [marine sediment metagenome]
LSGLDKRIKVSIPVDYITTWHSRIEADLSTDSEQLFPGSIAKGVDNRSDFTLLIAPRPLLIGIGITDPLNPYPGVKAFKPEILRLYEIFGSKNKVKFAEVDVGHTYSKQHRQALYQWLHKWFDYGSPGIKEETVKIEDESALWCTKTGQVLTSIGGRSVTDLNRDYAKKIIPEFKNPGSVSDFNLQRKEIISAAKKLTGYKKISSLVKFRLIGSSQLANYNCEKIIFYPEENIFIPGILIFPNKGNSPYPSVIYVDENNNLSETGSWEIIEGVLNKGVSVFII